MEKIDSTFERCKLLGIRTWPSAGVRAIYFMPSRFGARFVIGQFTNVLCGRLFHGIQVIVWIGDDYLRRTSGSS